MHRANGTSTTVGAPPSAAEQVAQNLRRWRRSRGLTVTAMAERAGVAKSTVSLIERGEGNPSVDTIGALSRALGIPPAALFEECDQVPAMEVVRAADTPEMQVPGSAGEQGALTARHLLTRSGGSLIDIFHVTYHEGSVHTNEGHAPGVFEHICVVTGSVEFSTDEFAEILGPGDLISFRADRRHAYRVVDGPAEVVCVQEYPGIDRSAAADPSREEAADALMIAAVENSVR